ncbi:glycosyltransferase family 39 protein [Thermincola potens]|uniref:Glycosyltransferase RgtA/B/C/D-like domain-containing protein n=1 Tax=Thermincola potens (strain JR) TaxID=635013 RepID=D5X821_THEPJ|nr:glycosyltransferase family 39 protein [Thermincola potens]ADG82741.1 hypothetical protein TherJR_1892 [Thermincola potens JR]
MVRLSGLIKTKSPYIVLVLVFLLCLILLVAVGGRVASDGYNYFAYLRSAVIDGDLDFHNDFQRYPKAFWLTYKPKDTVTGHFTNVFSVGPAILWAPFYLAAHLFVLVINQLGGSIPADGFSAPYQLAVSLASQAYAFAGILLVYRLLTRYFSASISLLATLTVWLGSFLLYYMIFEPSMSHCVSFFAVTLFIYLWHRSRKHRDIRDWFWLGLAAGLMMLVRWQNGIFMLLPALDAAVDYYKLQQQQRNYGDIRHLLAGHMVFLASAIAAFLPQMIVWKIIYGGFLTIPQGSSFMKWTTPFMLETLLSSRHGLFSWHPALYLGALGWFILFKRDKGLTIRIFLLFLAMTYVNSVVKDWWSGWAFGMRRFDGFLLFLALGLGSLLTAVTDYIKKRPAVAVYLCMAALIAGNILFMNQFRGRVIHQGGVVAFDTVFKNMVEQIYKRTGNPFSFPANLYFAVKYGEPPRRYDSLVGVYVDDPYFFGPKMDLGRQRFYLGKGWSQTSETWQGQFDYLRSLAVNPTVYMPLRSKGNYVMRIRMAPLQENLVGVQAFSDNFSSLRIKINKKASVEIRLDKAWKTYEISLPEQNLSAGINVLEFSLPKGQVIGIDYIEFSPRPSLSRE